MTTALISVSDKSGLSAFAAGLHALGIKLLSTGGTARLLRDEGLPVTDVSECTGFPEILDGRVKTLHPHVHAALLARRDLPEHMDTLSAHGIDPIDLVVVNLYPFEATVAQADATLADAIENIDIGGPSMIRSAAKNWRDVAVVTDPSQYDQVLQGLQQGGLSVQARFGLAQAAFARIAAYGSAISNYLGSIDPEEAPAGGLPPRSRFPASLGLSLRKLENLRYGENPHQQAAFYAQDPLQPGGIATARQLQGKALSYNNIADGDAAWECVLQWRGHAACVIVKHAGPCGVAVADTAAVAYERAHQTDPVSAFGGIIAFSVAVDVAAAKAVSQQFAELVIAPGYSPEALAIFRTRKNLRVLEIPLPDEPVGAADAASWQFKRVSGGMLVQTADEQVTQLQDLRQVSRHDPGADQLQDLLFAWKVVRFVKSNAIVFCRDGMTLGIGAGQPSRLDSARIAASKAEQAGLSLAGSVVASDAFFPFRDGLDVLAEHGAAAVIQPGGSRRDAEVIDAADEHGMIMMFTGVRHFRH